MRLQMWQPCFQPLLLITTRFAFIHQWAYPLAAIPVSELCAQPQHAPAGSAALSDYASGDATPCLHSSKYVHGDVACMHGLAISAGQDTCAAGMSSSSCPGILDLVCCAQPQLSNGSSITPESPEFWQCLGAHACFLCGAQLLQGRPRSWRPVHCWLLPLALLFKRAQDSSASTHSLTVDHEFWLALGLVYI